jgi:hypothetical protein
MASPPLAETEYRTNSHPFPWFRHLSQPTNNRGSLVGWPAQTIAQTVQFPKSSDRSGICADPRSAPALTAVRKHLLRLQLFVCQLAEELERLIELANRRAANPAASIELV